MSTRLEAATVADHTLVTPEPANLPGHTSADVPTPRKRSLGERISRTIWDRDDKPPVERKFVRRLDLGLMPMIMLGYYIKYLSQANVA